MFPSTNPLNHRIAWNLIISHGWSSCPIQKLPSGNQTWLAGQWTTDISDFPIGKLPVIIFSSGIFQPAMFDKTRGYTSSPCFPPLPDSLQKLGHVHIPQGSQGDLIFWQITNLTGHSLDAGNQDCFDIWGFTQCHKINYIPILWSMDGWNPSHFWSYRGCSKSGF